MEERSWKYEFLVRCEFPRLVWADGQRILVSDERHAAYWDENAKAVMLGPDAETHAMEMALLPEAEELADLEDEGLAEDLGGIAGLKRADAKERIAAETDVGILQGWLMETTESQVKGAIKARLAELG